jgi:murein DD-endopeptidase MepM/ murein hydrolase activator NlpD
VKRLLVILLAVAIQACASGGSRTPSGGIPTGWPVSRSEVVVTAEFGAVRGSSRHQGIDLSAPAGTPVRATADGKVVYAGKDGRYGKTVLVDHGGGYRTRYAHLKKIETKAGKRVRRGELIGRVGKSGNATGTHLHYEVLKNGVEVDPRPYLD